MIKPPIKYAAVLIFSLPLLFISACTQQRYKTASVYIAAHQDDWQLFMGSDFFNDVADPNKKVVLILTTSGCSKQSNFCLAREEGVLASIKYATGSPVTGVFDTGYISFKKFRIAYNRIKNVDALFLRLPDGNTTGDGFPEFGNVSLVRLREGKVKNISATDSINHFNSWNELVKATGGITAIALGSNQNNVVLHLPDTSLTLNPNDHPDHLASAQLALEAFADKKWTKFYYTQYQNEFLSDNLHGADSLHQKELFDAYDKTVTAKMGFCTTCYTDLYQKWCRRMYSRESR